MEIYKCTVLYRNLSKDGPDEKTYLIQADSPIAAYIKAQQETKNLYQVDKPRVKKWHLPSIDFICSNSDMIKQYGYEVYNEAKEDLEWRR